MSWLNFAGIIEEGSSNLEDWASAIEANPNTAVDALRLAIRLRIIETRSLKQVSLLSSIVIRLVETAIENERYKNAMKVLDDLLAAEMERLEQQGDEGSVKVAEGVGIARFKLLKMLEVAEKEDSDANNELHN